MKFRARVAFTLLGLTLLSPLAGAAQKPRAPEADPQGAAWDSLAHYEDRLRWAECESLGTVLAAQALARTPVDSMAYSRALLGVATGRLRRGLYRDGKGLEALETGIGIRERHAPPGDRTLGRAHALGAVAYRENGEVDRAVHHGLDGLRVASAATVPDTLLISQVQIALANAYVSLGKIKEAGEAYEAALRSREAKFGPWARYLVPPLAEYALFLSRHGDFDGARERIGRAVAISEVDSLLNSDLLENSLARASTIEDRAGNIAESIELAERALVQARRRRGETDIATVRARTFVAYRLSELGDHEAAATNMAEIVPLMEDKLGATSPQTINARLVWIDELEAIGDTAAARRELAIVGPALAGQEKFYNENQAHFRVLLAGLERAGGRYAAARDTLDRAIALEWARSEPLYDTLADLYLHQFSTDLGPADRAHVEHIGRETERLADSSHVRALPEWTELVLARARAESRAGLAGAAWTHALDAERRQRESFRYQLQGLPDQRALQLGDQMGEPCDVLVRLAESGDESMRRTAWDRIVRWRGLIRAEVARRRPPAVVPGDGRAYAAHAAWIKAQRRLAQLAVSGLAHPEDPETAQLFESARHDAESAERSYMRMVKIDAAPGDSVSLAAVRARLAPDATLVAFAVGATSSEDATLGAFVADGRTRRVRFVPLGRVEEIEAAIRAWTASLAVPFRSSKHANGNEQRSRGLGQRVRVLIWDPIARQLGTTREIFLVPEGALFEVPWLALPEGTGRRYLADAPLTVHVLNAERDLLRASERSAGIGLLAVGGPDFDRAPEMVPPALALASTFRSAHRPCVGGIGSLPPLAYARAEAEDIARDWARPGNTKLLVGAEASELSFKREAGGRAVIHLATHGVVFEDTCAQSSVATRGVGGVAYVATPKPRTSTKTAVAPAAADVRATPSWLSGRVWLALAGANRPPVPGGDENEGYLTAEEVVTLDLRRTDWVVLSACQSGIAPAWTREGVLGMRRAFHLAGARSVIASQWPIADEGTREWMRALYAARASGSGSAAAVRQACHEVLEARRRDGRSTYPFFWAAFTATGE